MSDWQERITLETAPSIRVEHELRYRIAAELVLSAGVWADLGCGNGIAAAAALGGVRPARTLLADLDADALARAAATLAVPDAIQIAGDLSDPDVLERLSSALLDAGSQPVVTCFEVVEHLSAFLPLIEWSASLAQEHAATFVLSVPNDAFWSIENPHHVSAWSDGSFAELCGMLPPERTMLRQVALSGSAILAWDAAGSSHELDVATGGDGTIATHFLVAFGPRHQEVHEGALAAQTDQLEQRRWERQREANLALAEDLDREQKQKLREQHESLRENIATFEAWRAYIHELERELGRPLSGQPPA
jgi:hypothetical protein